MANHCGSYINLHQQSLGIIISFKKAWRFQILWFSIRLPTADTKVRLFEGYRKFDVKRSKSDFLDVTI
jgi:hypothetical protein